MALIDDLIAEIGKASDDQKKVLRELLSPNEKKQSLQDALTALRDKLKTKTDSASLALIDLQKQLNTGNLDITVPSFEELLA